jgi:hypothetical protein
MARLGFGNSPWRAARRHTALITSAASLPPKASDVETPQRQDLARDVGNDVDVALRGRSCRGGSSAGSRRA